MFKSFPLIGAVVLFCAPAFADQAQFVDTCNGDPDGASEFPDAVCECLYPRLGETFE